MPDPTILDVLTKMDIPPERIVQGLGEFAFDSIVVVGSLKDGSEFFSSNLADGGTVLWHLERAKFKLLAIAQEAYLNPPAPLDTGPARVLPFPGIGAPKGKPDDEQS